ncbi:MAG: hypothetical protein JOZ81_25640 [Chloroflexi bacterium]|nr:hypothetical protein [Chloroflexota bacterium]
MQPPCQSFVIELLGSAGALEQRQPIAGYLARFSVVPTGASGAPDTSATARRAAAIHRRVAGSPAPNAQKG